ncbi:cytochrome P450 3A14-like [Centruroides vittatus]|uniref:cytochrome P450 3A14-like n=1 Tax=Centruroides vittatus TaxID=120091 RepID=UPI00350E9D7E
MIENAIFFTLLFLFVFLWYRKRKNDMTFFERLNIPGPKPHFITGNLSEYTEKGFEKCQLEWIEKYGNIVGYYLGAKPVLLVSDSDFWKLVQIKDFENFVDRDLFISDGGIPHKYGRETLSLKEGIQWKNARSILSPGFSTNKLKQTVPLVEDAIKVFLDIIWKKANNKEEFNIFPMYHTLTMDIIGRTAFGVRTNIQKNPEDIFVKNVKYISSDTVSSKTVWLILCFRELEVILSIFRIIMDKIKGFFGLPSTELLFKNLNDVIQSRKTSKPIIKASERIWCSATFIPIKMVEKKLLIGNDQFLNIT